MVLINDSDCGIPGQRRNIRGKAVEFGSLERGDRVGLVSDECRQIKQLVNVACPEQHVLVGEELILAIGQKIGAAAQFEWRETSLVI